MKKILLVVDYQEDFVTGSLGFPKAVGLDAKIAKRIRQAQKRAEMVIFTMDTHYEANYLETQEGIALPVPHCIKGEKGWNLYGETGKAVSNPGYIGKSTFGALGLLDVLKSYEEKDVTIEIVGVVTNMCVISNAIICKTILPEALIIINAELCASFDDELHEKALDVMESMQMKVIGR